MFKEESCGDKRLRLFGPKRAITPPNCFTELLMEGKVEASLTKLSRGRGLFWRTWEVLKKRSPITLKKICIPLKEFQGLEFMAFIEVLFLLARLERLFEVEEVRSAVDQCSAKKITRSWWFYHGFILKMLGGLKGGLNESLWRLL